MRILVKLLFFNFLITSWASGSDVLNILRSDHSYQNYYLIQHNLKSDVISLLDWKFKEDPHYALPEDYHRLQHFKGWIRDPSYNTCFDTRNLVLIKNAESSIVLKSKNNCEVLRSKWFDVYTSQYFYRASDVDIDHVVPLRSAYYAGASEWSKAKRCNYSNFMYDPFHLLVVEKKANRSKGDSGPEKFLPRNIRFQCFYVSIWLKIKAYWNLKIALQEADAIRSFLSRFPCPEEFFKVNADDFLRIKSQTEAMPLECLK